MGLITTTTRDVRVQAATTSARDYLALTKPRHVLPSTLTAWIAMALAAGGSLPAGRVIGTLVGTALAIAASHAYNALLEKDLDALMDRTRGRPLPAGRIAPRPAFIYATALSFASLAVVYLAANLLASGLALAGILFYALVYTYWAKRRTPWNTLIGGVAGGVPPLIGWAAATGTLDWPAFILFSVMVVWQPLHFFALSLLVADDYRRAGFPMVVAVQGEQATLRQIVVYSVMLVVLSLLLHLLGTAGTLYLSVALALGAVYVGAAVKAARRGPAEAKIWGRWLLRYAFLYLTVLLLAAVLDRTV